MPKVSVIMAAYNGGKTIKESIRSVLNQEYWDLELIVVDSQSTDNTLKIIRSFDDDRIVVLAMANKGAPAAPRNLAVSKSKGEIIAICDQDDIFYPEKLEKQIKAYEESSYKDDVGIIISSADLIDEAGKVITKNIKPFEGYMDNQKAYARMLNGDFITACSALIPKKIFNEVGGLDESLIGVDDYELWLRINKKYGILTIKEPLCAWRQHENSLSANRTNQYLENEKIFKKLDDSLPVRVGHGKNLTRIFLGLTLVKDFKEAKKYRDEAIDYPLSLKIKLLIGLFDLSPYLAYFLINFLQSIGRASL